VINVHHTIYQLNHITKAYDGRTVMNIEQLAITAGEILAVVGPSGAGKSTLLRHLNFLELPDAGVLTFLDQNWSNRLPPLEIRRQVTTVFQRPLLLNRSVAANVAYGLKLRGQHGSRVKQAVVQALERVGLGELGQAAAHTLSGGEAQRVALARALVVQPRVLLLDEPTANLDPYNINLIEQIIAQVNQQHGTTVVLVTHNIFQAKRLAQRTALLLNGRLVEVAPTATFFDQPHDPLTAAFVRGELVY
jgi:tungstate transport system ATP-binding protein